MTSLVARIREVFSAKESPPWFPELTPDLVDTAWRKLEGEIGLTPASYSMARVLLRSSEETRRVVASFTGPLSDEVPGDAILVELLSGDLVRRSAGLNVRLLGAAEVAGARVSGLVEEALGILAAVPTVLPTIRSLIRSLHFIDSGNDDVDVSFSLPGLPFSAFVSVPGASAVAGALRVAEALLHEAMHLQLTLAEAIVPLVTATERTYFSPWRNEYRTAQGVLHALYVFRVIEAFLGAAPFETQALTRFRAHSDERRATIAHQVREIREFRRCSDLTADGAAFVDRLLG